MVLRVEAGGGKGGKNKKKKRVVWWDTEGCVGGSGGPGGHEGGFSLPSRCLLKQGEGKHEQTQVTKKRGPPSDLSYSSGAVV